MAFQGSLPPVNRIITGHNKEGLAIHDKSVPREVPWQVLPNNRSAFGLVYTTTAFPADMRGDKDLATYQEYVNAPPGLVNNSGTVIRIVDFSPGKQGVMHRTVSLDYGIVLIGEMEHHLDSGEVEHMKVGDIMVQRGTMHEWRNHSDTQWARMLFVLQPSHPLEFNGKTYGEEYGNLEGVRRSS